jgi:hypothetical protein
MLALQIEIDDQPPLIAGAEDWSVLSAHVNALRGNPEEKNEPDLDMSVGGLTGRNTEGVAHHFRWARVPLKIGSTVKVTLVEVASVHAPAKRYRSDSKVQEDPFTEEELREMRRLDYLELKKEFEGASDA